MALKTMGALWMTRTVFLLVHVACTAGEATVQIIVENGVDVDNLEEGDNVTMRCEARGLGLDSRVIWQHTIDTLAMTDRLSITTEELGSRGDTSQDRAYTLTISPVLGRDRGLYRCRIVESYPGGLGEYVVQQTEEVTLTIFTFPNETSPVCSPGGPVTVRSGDIVPLSCATFPGYPAVNVSIISTDVTFRNMQWSTKTGNEDTIVRWLDWEATLAQDGAVISCDITSVRFPSYRMTCTIGPISVMQKTQSTSPHVVTSTTVFESPTTKLISPMPVGPMGSPTVTLPISKDFPWLYAFLLSVAMFALSIAVNIVLCSVVWSMRLSRLADKEANAQDLFIENKNKNLRLSGIDNAHFNMSTISDVSSCSPI